MTDLHVQFRSAKLPNYFEALPDKFIEQIIDDETHFRENKFKMLEDEYF